MKDYEEVKDEALAMAIAAKAHTPLVIGQIIASTEHSRSMTYLGQDPDGLAMGEYPGSGVLHFPMDTVFATGLYRDYCASLIMGIDPENSSVTVATVRI
jgi:hypothetical protein